MPGPSATDATLERLADAGLTALDDGDLAQARAYLEAADALALPHASTEHLRAQLEWETSGPAAAVAPLERCLALAPDHADAHHLLACALQVLDEVRHHAKIVAHFEQVLRLDRAADRAPPPRHLLALVEQTAERTLASLPPDLAARVAGVPVVLESRPHARLVAEGFDPRALGLFEGAEAGTDDALPVPRRIVLFVANLAATFADDAELADEVEITVLHEIGHYFGLDEDGVARLGLE